MLDAHHMNCAVRSDRLDRVITLQHGDGNMSIISATRVRNENTGVVKLLLHRGAYIEAEDGNNNTSLQFASGRDMKM